MDNWYNSIPLAIDLLKNHNTTVVGTLRKNKREIPLCFLETKKRQLNSTMFGYDKDILLTSYVPKKKIKMYCLFPLCTNKVSLIQSLKKENQR